MARRLLAAALIGTAGLAAYREYGAHAHARLQASLRSRLATLQPTSPGAKLDWFQHGPDTDQILGRRDGCHWDAAGCQLVAQAWAEQVYTLLDRPDLRHSR